MKQERIIEGHQVLWDGRTVWINSSDDGSSIGRFGRGGVDVHRNATEQMNGASQCLDCSLDPSLAGWERFKMGMMWYHRIEIPETCRPTFLGHRGDEK